MTRLAIYRQGSKGTRDSGGWIRSSRSEFKRGGSKRHHRWVRASLYCWVRADHQSNVWWPLTRYS
eukprot:7384854-Prymnesium_polylepis.1